ncbi:MAG: Mov34/MPN/PAD-1 family protein [Planctomycetes bacterium]|nr:Mov34/MPN/PAD-1 family protein [Planctomycetota bacterium]
MTASGPDIRDISPKDLEKGRFGGAGNESLRVALAETPYNEIVKHGLEHAEVEVCGVLVGRLLQDEGGPFLEIEAVIRGEHAASQGAQVTFTHETWNHIHNEMDRRFQNRRIVGWYHTHPGFGIFLSEFDLFIHRSFFNAPFQVAFVFDPRSGDEGFFCWKEGETSRLAHFWVGRTMHCCRPAFEEVRRPPAPGSPGTAGPPPTDQTTPDAGGGATAADPDRIGAPPLWSLVTPILLILCGMFVGFLAGTHQGRREADAVLQGAIEHEVREMVRMQVMHTGLSTEMQTMERIVADSVSTIDTLSKSAPPPGGTVPADQARQTLEEVRSRLVTLREKYETMDRLVTSAMKRGAASVEQLESQVVGLRGQLLELRRIVMLQMVQTARSLLDQAALSDDRSRNVLKTNAREMYDRAIVLTPEDRATIDRLFPEFAPPPDSGKKKGPADGESEKK